MNALADLPVIDDAALAAGPGPVEIRKDSGTAVVTFEQFAVAPLEAIRAGLVALANRYDRVAFDLTTPRGLEEAKAARHDLRENGRYAVQRAGEKFKKDANAAKKKADALVIELAAIVEPVEDRLDKAIKAREAEIEREREAKRAAEAERVAKHRAAIDTIKAYLTHAQQPGMTSERIARGLSALGSMPKIGPETFEEFADEAAAAYTETFNAMHALHERVLADEMRAAEVERQRVENERVARELAERQAELDRQAEALRQQRADMEAARIKKFTGHEPSELVDMAGPDRVVTVQLGTGETPAAGNGEAPRDAPADEGNVPLPAAAGAYASSEPQAAQGSPSGDEGTGAHAEERAPEPATIVVSGELSASKITTATLALNLGTIQKRLGFPVGADFLASLGFTGTRERSAMLYQEHSFAAMCSAIASHVLSVGESHAQK